MNAARSPEIAVADIGGTNARFARAAQGDDGAIKLSQPAIFKTADYPDFAAAWRAFLGGEPGFEPQAAALALAGPASQGRFKLTNGDWEFDAADIGGAIGVPRAAMYNDFEALAHATAYFTTHHSGNSGQ